MTLNDLNNMHQCLTHAGQFHADDVFSAAFLTILNPDLEIIRSLTIPDNFEGIVFDIGLGEFDHHQNDNELRDNGIPYAAFGKLWRNFAPEKYGKELTIRIDKKLIQYLDLFDNTGSENALAYAISLFNPTWDSDSNGDKEFLDAVEIAKQILIRMIDNEKKLIAAGLIVKEIYEQSSNKQIIIMDRYYPYKDVLPETEAIYVIYPSKRSGYVAQGVTINSHTIELKKSFPSEWKDHLPKHLKFCHNRLFLISSDTLEGAIKACEDALKR